MTQRTRPRRRPDRGGTQEREVRTYYGKPVVKPPAWTWEVPTYLFTGGLAGASSLLALAARRAGNDDLARNARVVAAAGAALSPPLLVSDLKRPRRFLNMLRVFRPTSPMNMGSWLLSLYAPAAVGAAGAEALGVLPRLRGLAGTLAGVLGAPLATYSGVLVADSSIPTWHEARHELPFLFAGSAAAAAGAAATLLTEPRHAAPARRLALVGAALEVGSEQVMERRLGDLAEPYEHGRAGAFTKLARALTAGGAAVTALGGRRRRLGAAGAVMLLAGSLCQRWAVFRAGFQSAESPELTVRHQRERLERGEGYRAERDGGEDPAEGGGTGRGRPRELR